MLSVEELNDRLIDLAFAEDIGDGDHTTLCCIPADQMGESKLLIKEEGIFAGVEIAKQVFHRFDPTMEVEVYVEDGAHVIDYIIEVIRGSSTVKQVKECLTTGNIADIRFKKAVGHTIGEEIHAVQLEEAKRLLADPSRQIKAIGDFCGFSNESAMRKFFRRETGMSMSDWRKRQRNAIR